MSDNPSPAEYEAPEVEDLMVEHGPAGVVAGSQQQSTTN
jgi:hypothetical protein